MANFGRFIEKFFGQKLPSHGAWKMRYKHIFVVTIKKSKIINEIIFNNTNNAFTELFFKPWLDTFCLYIILYNSCYENRLWNFVEVVFSQYSYFFLDLKTATAPKHTISVRKLSLFSLLRFWKILGKIQFSTKGEYLTPKMEI